MDIATHSGNMGDLIYSLVPLKRMTSAAAIYIPHGFIAFMSPLLSLQPFIKSVHALHDLRDTPVNYYLDRFRQAGAIMERPLILTNLSIWNLPYKDWNLPWLVNPNPVKMIDCDYTLINVTNRYAGGFDWKTEVSYLSSFGKPYFIGAEAECNEFNKKYGTKVEWFTTHTLKEVADLITYSKVNSCNQSLFLTICQGLGIPYRLEVCTNPLHTNTILAAEIETIVNYDADELYWRTHW